MKTEECELLKLKVEKLKKKCEEIDAVRTSLGETIKDSANHKKWNMVYAATFMAVFILFCGVVCFG